MAVTPTVTASALYQTSRLMEEPVISPLYTSDLKHTPLMHAKMNTGDVLLGDIHGHATCVRRRVAVHDQVSWVVGIDSVRGAGIACDAWIDLAVC